MNQEIKLSHGVCNMSHDYTHKIFLKLLTFKIIDFGKNIFEQNFNFIREKYLEIFVIFRDKLTIFFEEVKSFYLSSGISSQPREWCNLF
jgi:hypothetical protein